MAKPLIIRTQGELNEVTSLWKQQGAHIGLVPTMGALHEGHLSLVTQIADICDHVITTIFVNPAQFAAHEDLGTYPRTEEQDCAKLASLPVSLIYLPRKEYIYPQDFATSIQPQGAALGLEAAARPHFFSGVATIVTKLINQTRADYAIFGEKDYQQLLVIKQITRDLDMAVNIIAAPIIREADGLAMSSRNLYLTAPQRKIAGKLNLILTDMAHARLSPEEAKQALMDAGFSAVDYAVICDGDTLGAVGRHTKSRRALIAASLDGIRLLDNMPVF